MLLLLYYCMDDNVRYTDSSIRMIAHALATNTRLLCDLVVSHGNIYDIDRYIHTYDPADFRSC